MRRIMLTLPLAALFAVVPATSASAARGSYNGPLVAGECQADYQLDYSNTGATLRVTGGQAGNGFDERRCEIYGQVQCSNAAGRTRYKVAGEYRVRSFSLSIQLANLTHCSMTANLKEVVNNSVQSDYSYLQF